MLTELSNVRNVDSENEKTCQFEETIGLVVAQVQHVDIGSLMSDLRVNNDYKLVENFTKK